MKAKGDYDAAIKTFETAVDKFPTKSWPWSLLGDALKAKGDYDGAIKTFQTAVDKFPMDSWLWKALGETYYVKEYVEATIKQYQTAFQHLPNDYLFPKLLGDIHSANHTKLGYENAVNAYNLVIRKAPNPSILWAYLYVPHSDQNETRICP